MKTTMNQSKKDTFLLVNVPLLRPAWPVPTFSRILPLLRSSGYHGDWWDENIKFFRYFYSEEKLIQARHLIMKKLSCSTDAFHRFVSSLGVLFTGQRPALFRENPGAEKGGA